MIPPLKELFVVAVLIWLGAFLCMIPQMIADEAAKRLVAKNTQYETTSLWWVNAHRSQRGLPPVPYKKRL